MTLGAETGGSTPVQQLSNNSGAGVTMGQSTTDLISFYNVNPVVQPTGFTAVVTTGATSSSPYGFTSSQANAIVTAVNLIGNALRTLGLTS